ncbi:ROK family protein [Neobacillus bataviensis]|uniref:ROK family protein n=1 Tax=Neobacillus bataviensis TaxID=220685 RepID=UPI001CC120E2|nr:ROK family protein [Neobacillus bataviensis]
MDQPVVIGMDIGGTKTLIGLVNSQGEPIAKYQFPTDILSSPEEHLLKCINAAKNLLLEANIKTILGIGVNAPGLVDSKKGLLIHAPYLGWRNINVREIIQQFWPNKRVQIANDVNACAVGELLFGKGKNFNDFLWVTISTGIGGGLILNNQLVEGNSLLAGEIGHFVVEWENGYQCSCGNRGCLEAYSSGKAIADQTKRQIEQDKHGGLAAYFNRRKLSISAENTAAAAYEGIKPALAIYHLAGNHLGRAFSYAINLLNPAAIFIGGGVSQSLDLLKPSIHKVLENSVISETNKSIPIITTGLGLEAGLIGAASLIYLDEFSY